MIHKSSKTELDEKSTKVLLYSPVYYTSPGTQMRIDLIRKSLSLYGIKSMLIYEDRESISQKIYHSSLTENIFTKNAFWHLIGALLARKLCRWSKYSKAIILFIDICASALPYLRKCFDKVILSVEDLTPRYKYFTKEAIKKYLEIFTRFAQYADYIITPAYTLTRELRELGLEAHTVPIGLEPYITPEEALRRNLPIKILHAGQLNMLEQVKVVLNLARKYAVILHNQGKYVKLLKNISHLNIQKYKTKSPHNAVKITKNAHIGLIISNRPAYTLSRLYFHVALLQPMIGRGVEPWITEAKELGIDLEPISEEVIESIVQDYELYIKKLYNIQFKLSIPTIHKKLIDIIS